jgi:hypothetical protein
MFKQYLSLFERRRRILLYLSSNGRRCYAIRINREGEPTPKLFRNKPSKESISKANSTLNSSAKSVQQDSGLKPEFMKIQTSSDQQCQYLQQLMRMLIAIEMEKNHDSFSSENIGFSGNEQQLGADYMLTFQFFRHAAGYRNWWFQESVAHSQDAGKHFTNLNLVVRIFTDKAHFANYKKELAGPDSQASKEDKLTKITNISQFVYCLIMNEKIHELGENETTKKKELLDQMSRSQYSFVAAHIPDKINKIIIDDQSDHSFSLHKQYFPALIRWYQILRLETAVHCIRLWALPNSAQNKFDNSVFIKEDKVLCDDPIQVLLDHDRWFILKKPNRAWILIPGLGASVSDVEPRNNHIPIFTAPDFAYQFADDNDIDHSCVRTISGSKLFQILDHANERVEGIVVNPGNRAPYAINQEISFTREFIRAVAEIDAAEEDEEETVGKEKKEEVQKEE